MCAWGIIDASFRLDKHCPGMPSEREDPNAGELRTTQQGSSLAGQSQFGGRLCTKTLCFKRYRLLYTPRWRVVWSARYVYSVLHFFAEIALVSFINTRNHAGNIRNINPSANRIEAPAIAQQKQTSAII